MKVVKIMLKTILWVVALVIVALLALPFWFGPVVKTAANTFVPGVVKTDFHLGHLSLNPYTARFELGDMQLWNPAGYSEKFAVKVGAFVADAATLSLVTDVIRLEEVCVKDVFASYVSGGENKVNNFTQIQYNVAGGKEKFKQAEAEKKDKVAESAPSSEATGPSKKVIIDKLTISGVKVQVGIVPISVPFEITLTDIGKDSGGATLVQVKDQIWAAVLKAAGNVAGMIGDATAAAAKAAGDATAAAGDAAKAVGGAAGDAAKAVGDTAGKALDAINKLW